MSLILPACAPAPAPVEPSQPAQMAAGPTPSTNPAPLTSEQPAAPPATEEPALTAPPPAPPSAPPSNAFGRVGAPYRSIRNAGGVHRTEAEALAAWKDAPLLGLLRAGATADECTGAGGFHVSLQIIETDPSAKVTTALHGWHIYRPRRPIQSGYLFVAMLKPGKWVPNTGLCLDLPPADAFADHLLPVKTVQEGRALIARARRGP